MWYSSFKIFSFPNFYFFFVLKGISPDVITYSTLMKAFIRVKKFDKVPSAFKASEVTWLATYFLQRIFFSFILVHSLGS